MTDLRNEYSPPRAKQLASAMLVWLALGAGTGFLSMASSGANGSIAFVFLAIMIGVAGASAHTGLLFARQYRGLRFSYRTVTLWLTAVAVLSAFALLLALQNDEGFATGVSNALFVVGVYCSGPMLLGAALGVHLVERVA